ncbi:histidine kinase [Sediminicoccus sp. KRV36]|uniref:sensor histidine kinase n=1 Tax=Sediminicoccus sp. KRV36 TaxID=3133721 RepID=UPI0020105931|nr:histidine kinase [Sediminicoccus rosea]UPY39384.1 histidine kinase [Sediminicoccus rosea]
MMDSARQTPMAMDPGALPGLGRVQPAALAIFVLVDVMAHVSVYASFGVALGIALVLEPVILLLALALRRAFGQLRASEGITPRMLPWIVGLSLLAALVAVIAGQMVRAHFALEFDPRSGRRAALIALIYYFLVFVLWSVICFWTRAEMERQAQRQRAIQAEAQALRAELERLRLQIDPHFLFNALNGIAEEIPDNPDAALMMLRNLAVFLRQSLVGIETPLVTVAAEAEALAAYLRVQQARFGARLALRLDVSPEAKQHLIPSLLLQPLVENAIKHGTRDPVLEVAITIGMEGGALQAVVANSGCIAPGDKGRSGIGLPNIRNRLLLHYPGRHSFDLEERGGMVVARLRLEGEPCSGS